MARGVEVLTSGSGCAPVVIDLAACFSRPDQYAQASVYGPDEKGVGSGGGGAVIFGVRMGEVETD